MKKFGFSAVIFLIATVVLASVAFASSPWLLCGNATPVQEGEDTDSYILQLTGQGADCSGVRFVPPNGQLKFADISQLSVDYQYVTGDVYMQPLKFSLFVDMDNDGVADKSVMVKILKTKMPPMGWQSTGNLIGTSNFDTSAFRMLGGKMGDTYAHTLELIGDKNILGVSLMVKSPMIEQTIYVDNFVVNNHKMSGENATLYDGPMVMPPMPSM